MTRALYGHGKGAALALAREAARRVKKLEQV
jgi:hypothetical protein